MNITGKFIYALTKEAFERELPNIPPNLNPIVFIEDTRELWTYGTYFSLGYPAIKVSEISGSVKVEIGNDNFTLQTSGSGFNITKGTGNNIILSSSALTSINTVAPLNWNDITKQLTHTTSGVNVGNYGQSNSLNNASTFTIPNITVDVHGHVTNVQNSIIAIRDYVEQIAPSEGALNRNILLSYNESGTTTDVAQVRKARGLYYNDAIQLLTVGGGIVTGGSITVNEGNLTVIGGKIIGDLEGNVTGEATPKIHLSLLPEYGGASLNLYGHVKLQDVLGTEEPLPSSSDTNTGSADIVRGVAASPKMVWDVKQTLEEDIARVPYIGGITAGESSIVISAPNQNLTIVGANGIGVGVQEGNLVITSPGITGVNGVSVSMEDGGFIVSGVNITATDESNVVKTISNNLKFGTDFSVDNENTLSIRWNEL